jgi:hypothetical protein
MAFLFYGDGNPSVSCSEAVKKLKIKKKRLSPTRVGRLENFRAKPYEENHNVNLQKLRKLTNRVYCPD